MCCHFGWDKDGDLLAAITDKSSNLLIWDANTRRSQWLDSGIRDPLNVLIWSKTGPNLAIGSYRGNLMLYNHRTSGKVPVVGKHNKAITCGAWSEANLLALGSEDRTLSISNVEGDTLRVATLRAEPSDVQFSEMKQVLYKLHLFWITHLTRWLGTISKSFELIFSSNNFTF